MTHRFELLKKHGSVWNHGYFPMDELLIHRQLQNIGISKYPPVF
jgi:hypothetical protein